MGDDLGALRYLVSGLIAPFVLATVLAVPLWIIRRYFPRAEPYFYGPLYNVGRLMGSALGRLIRAVRRRAA